MTALVVAGLGMAGCSPGHWPTVSMLLVGGEPTILAAPCPADSLTMLVVSEVSDGDTGDWPQWRSQGARPLADGETVPLLDDPADWRTTTAELTTIQPERRYHVRADGEQISFTVDFTLDELSGLDEGQVWANTDGRGSRAVRREEFERAAGADCGRH